MSNRSDSSAFDPICGMRVESSHAEIVCVYLGRAYAFCCVECRDIFLRAPEDYVGMLAHEPGESAGHLCPLSKKKRLAAEE